MKYVHVLIIAPVLASFIISLAQGTAFRCRSRCDHCGHTLRFRDMIPVVGYLLLKGRCRHCGRKISLLYPLGEISVTAGCLVIAMMHDLSAMGLSLMAVWLVMSYVIFSDIGKLIIPDLSHLLFLVIRMIMPLPFGRNDLLTGAFMAAYVLVLGLLCKKIFRKDCLGLGDVKLFFSLGIYLDLYHDMTALLVSACLALAYALIFGKKEGPLPYGPFICAAYFWLIVANPAYKMVSSGL